MTAQHTCVSQLDFASLNFLVALLEFHFEALFALNAFSLQVFYAVLGTMETDHFSFMDGVYFGAVVFTLKGSTKITEICLKNDFVFCLVLTLFSFDEFHWRILEIKTIFSPYLLEKCFKVFVFFLLEFRQHIFCPES